MKKIITISIPLTMLVASLSYSQSNKSFNGSASGRVSANAVSDREPPVIRNCPHNMTVYTNNSTDAQCSASARWTSPDASDNHRVESFVSNYQSGDVFSVGTHTVTYNATDPDGNSSTCSFTVTVIDRTVPSVSVTLSTTELWPPNHRMVNITATVNAADNCSSGSNLVWVLESITSNENDEGYGDGDMPNDIQNANFNTPDLTFSLRRERSGRGNDRVYTITYKATDAAGNISRASATVTVPHNR